MSVVSSRSHAVTPEPSSSFKKELKGRSMSLSKYRSGLS